MLSKMSDLALAIVSIDRLEKEILENESKFSSKEMFKAWLELMPLFRKSAVIVPQIAEYRETINKRRNDSEPAKAGYEKIRIKSKLTHAEFYIALRLNGNIWANDYYPNNEHIDKILKRLETVSL